MDDESQKWLDQIQEACGNLGWKMYFDDGEQGLHGMIIGSVDFIEGVMLGTENFESYELFEVMTTNNKDIH